MDINTNNLVSITEANQNFSKVARLVDENGYAVILKNNVPRYLIVVLGQAEKEQFASDEDVISISKRLIAKNKQAYDMLKNYPYTKACGAFRGKAIMQICVCFSASALKSSPFTAVFWA